MDNAFEWLCDQPDIDLKRLSDILGDAESGSAQVCAEMNALADFLVPENLQLINAWSRQQDTLQAEIRVFRPMPNKLTVWRGRHAAKPIVLHPNVDQPAPEPPALIREETPPG
ncbi:hypothetical protein [Aureimonas sp. Leaf454]|uniref:hypothetical protein n=1 Tax=Aureimonas sp. Leaf454 TaxID=1736381 RepID=UPI0012E3A782|nr:hypothetical protein [Aureimonas sp. Leaf454]